MSGKRPLDRFIKVGDVKARFWTAGTRGPAVVLLHGIGAAVESWENTIAVLAENHRVYALDLIGFGRSDKPRADYGLELFTRFVKEFVDAQQLDKIVLVGWSLGGGVSLRFAIQFPYKLEKLVLIAPLGLGRKINAVFRMISVSRIGRLLSRPNRNHTQYLLKRCVFDPSMITSKVVDMYHAHATLPGARAAFESALRHGVGVGGVRSKIFRYCLDNLQTISVPTLIVWGRQDRILPVAQAYAAREKIFNARVHVLERCGHMPQLEKPEEFNSVVLSFLTQPKAYPAK